MATDHPIMASVAGRYAQALFEAASEQGQQVAVEADLQQVQAMLDSSEDLRRLVRNPVFSSDEQSRAMSAVAARAGLGPLTANLLRVLGRNRRLFTLPDIITAYRALAARTRGEVGAEVTSAVPLTPAQVQELGTSLQASVGKTVQMTMRVDPALLGGLVVKIGSRMIDSSLRTKLNSLKMRMKEVG